MLAKLGFRKRANAVFTMEIANDLLGWLGLNRATKHRQPREVEINPVVGVRHQGIERLVAELRKETFHAYQPPTISTPLGYLLPESRYRAWIFAPDRSASTARDMVSAIERYGVSFMRSIVDFRDLRNALDKGIGIEHQLVYRRPVAQFLAGDLGRARQTLDDSLASLGERSDLAAAEFRRFAQALRQRLSPS